MKIVLAAPRFFPFLGGVETSTRELARRFADRGHEITVVTSNPGSSLPAEEQIDGVQVVRVPSWPGRGDPFVAPSAGKVALSLHPDVVHVQGYQSAFTPFVLRSTSRAGVPNALTFHGGAHPNALRHALYPVQRRIFAPMFRRVKALVVTAPFEIPLLAQELGCEPERFELIPDGSDLPAPDSSIEPDPTLITSIGRLDKAKGHDRVIRAFGILAGSDSALRLTIIGQGDDRSRLEGIVAELSLGERVTFTSFPPTDRQGLAGALVSAGLVISMSKWETHPMAVIEAASLGCNIAVCTLSPGMRDLVDECLARPLDDGLDDTALAAEMRNCLEVPHVPDTRHLLTWDQSVDATEALYERLLAT